ncbi:MULTISPECIES: hypothetical protein [unclassified Crossiella]|uniref:hypothetical protein n=1 Tax=unclassified Crossiella TaxID=2620835 RepID=UPI001FFEEFBB|nr:MULTISPECIES: hypothetical protein [unclassified Crossiella]MCK2239113.1 hypothetical protein [Crossiella sp. S99.2]MCK2251318.1 hypothetical protein [Crossiella sp. S99.1]
MTKLDYYGAIQWLLNVLRIPVDVTGLAGDDLGPLWALLILVWLVFVPYSIIRWWSGRTLSHELLSENLGTLPFLHFGLLVLSFGLAGQPGDAVTEAVVKLVSEKLPETAPVAVLTQMALTLLFWLVFTHLLAVPWHTRATPVLQLVSQISSLGTVFVLTAAWMGVGPFQRVGEPDYWLTGLLVTPAILIPVYLHWVAYNPPEDEEPWWTRLLAPPGWLLWRTLRAALGYAGIGVLFSLPFWYGIFPPPTFAAVLGVQAFVLSISFLLWCNRWTESMLDEQDPDIPAALPRFVHLSLALSAGALGVASLPSSGPNQVWLLGVGLPVLVAVLLYLARVNRERGRTDRWQACLVAALAGAVLVVPVKLGLTALLTVVTGA